MFHILVADDDKNTRRLMQAVLEREGAVEGTIHRYLIAAGKAPRG